MAKQKFLELQHKPVYLFPKLHNIKPFIQRDHPVLHPNTSEYKRYWESIEIKCLEGLWGLDKNETTGEGGYRYMPPQLFYYINLCIIADEDDKGNTTIKKHPDLRDVEWLFAYNWLICRGFSGFSEDEEYTCHRSVEKLEKNIELSPKEKRRLEKAKDRITKPDGTYKKYMNARDYLYKTHHKPLGKPYYDNRALNMFVLGSRGGGKSYWSANGVVGHEFNFFGKKYFDKSYLERPQGPEIFVGAAYAAKSTDLLKKFQDTQKHLMEIPGAWNDMLPDGTQVSIPGYFHNNTTGSLQPSAKKVYSHLYPCKRGNSWGTCGTGTSLYHGVYTTENPQAAVGTRPTVMLIEEVGLLGNALKVTGANETCMIRKDKFGSAMYIGTSGNMEKLAESKVIFENPDDFDFISFPDVFEGRNKPIGFFLPAYYVDQDFKDENGNTKVEEAFAQEMYTRKQKRESANMSAYEEYIANRPIVPSEMFIVTGQNIFPVAAARERLAEVDDKNIFKLYASQGSLHYDPKDFNTVFWKEDLDRKAKPIRHVNLDSYAGEYTSSIVIYEHPPDRLPDAKFRNALYKIVYDPIKDDHGGTSLACILVYKGYTDTWEGGLQHDIVAEYIGRLDLVDDVHEIAIKLAMYYNAKILVETNIPDFVRYCRMKKRYYLLQPTPFKAIEKAIKNPGKKYDVGVSMNTQLGIYCEQRIRQLLSEPYKRTEQDDALIFVHKLKSPRLLEEIIFYNREEKNAYDAISALKLLALWLSQEELDPVADPYEESKNDPYRELSITMNKLHSSYRKEAIKNDWYDF